MKVINEKVPYFGDDGNTCMCCSESTLRLLIERGIVDMPVEVVKLMSGLHGNMGRNPTCGAVNGAVAAIGANFGRCEGGHPNDIVYRLTEKFLTEFENRFGTVKCPELIKNNDFTSFEAQYRCSEYVLFAADTVQKLIEDEKKNME